MYDEIREAFEIQKAEAPARPVIQRKTIENGEEDPSDFSDVADADVDAFVLSAEEARKKAEMWERMNEDYITRQEEKNKLREAREQAAPAVWSRPVLLRSGAGRDRRAALRLR